ncbi:MAG: hypothetical protein H0U99_05370 [Chthoniobacterales bacterium]|nr:hypothetical protein [Chthoniobacterales bacterium]
MLAHNHIDTSEDAIAALGTTDQVTFVRYQRGEAKPVKVSTADAKQRADEANKLRRELLTIQKQFFAANQPE